MSAASELASVWIICKAGAGIVSLRLPFKLFDLAEPLDISSGKLLPASPAYALRNRVFIAGYVDKGYVGRLTFWVRAAPSHAARICDLRSRLPHATPSQRTARQRLSGSERRAEAELYIRTVRSLHPYW